MSAESFNYDVVIVGAGPAGLSAAIRLAQLAQNQKTTLKICIVEKGASVGAHILSGAILEPRALDELLPDWRAENHPLKTPVTKDAFWLLGKERGLRLPTPPQMHNKGNYVTSLGNVCQWLAEKALNLGIEIFPGFAARDVIKDENGQVIGITTNDFGIGKKGEKKNNFQAGIAIFAKYTVLAEGCRGSLSKKLMEEFKLRDISEEQTYGLAVKELWEIDPEKHQAGSVFHSVGWPLDPQTYGGSFVYHMQSPLLSIGFVVGLDYKNPYLDPFQELQRFKTHPYIRKLLEGGRCIGYGAKALNEGGLQAIPKLCFPGGLLIGCAAGFLNVPKLKGSHTAMKSGMLAAEAIFEGIQQQQGPLLQNYQTALKNSWVFQELYLARNIRPAFRWGLWAGLSYAAIDTYLLRGRAPWTFQNSIDHLSLKKAADSKPIVYPKPDGHLTFDKLTALQWSNTNHEEDQPPHLLLKNPKVPIEINLPLYDAPEQRYCPAKVYEIIYPTDQQAYLQINAQNCLHCKTCDIKDPTQNIEWVPPEGGGGPNYENM